MKTVNIFLKICVVFSFLFLSSCSSEPDSNLGEQSIKEILDKQSQGNISVNNFEKTNGIKREIAGQPIYTLEYITTIVFNKGGWKWQDIGTGYFNDFKIVEKEPQGWNTFMKNWKYFYEGDEVELTGDITYEKTENGWRMTEYKVKTYKITYEKVLENIISKFLGKWSINGISFEISKVGKEIKAIVIDQNNKTSNATVSYGNDTDMIILSGDFSYPGQLKNELYISIENNEPFLWQGKGRGTGGVGITHVYYNKK